VQDMTSPVMSGNRRRQRSTRVLVAVLLLVLATLAVAGTAVTGSWALVTIAAGAALVLGAAATKITHTELLDSRQEAARDRAAQARAYADLTEVRTAENVEFAADMTGKVAKRDATIARLEKRLGDAAAELADARRELVEAGERAEEAQRTADRLTRSLADAEERAGQAVVRVAELEAELDVLTSQIHALEARARAQARRPA
jgi:chromosome segregation ATPase